jgi:cardiolipin synthase
MFRLFHPYSSYLAPAWINLPNLITVLRLVLAGPVVYAITAGKGTIALVLFIAAGLTDFLDGAVARRLKVATQTGAYLDPIADKLLLTSVFLALMEVRIIPIWFVVLVLARDILILTGAASIMAFTGLRKFPPSRLGKLSTFFQISCAVMWMVRNAWPTPVLNGLAQLSIWLSGGFTLTSGLDYIRLGIKMVRAKPLEPGQSRIDGANAPG